MLTREEYQRLVQSLPILLGADPQLQRTFQAAAYFARIPAGRDVFVQGDHIDAIALLLSGVVRVYKVGENGREITLYRFGLGESCVLTANAILSQATFPAIATVEQEAEAVMVPADVFREWVHRYALWRDLVFDLMSQRLASVLDVVDAVVFQRMDTRLAAFLLRRSQPADTLYITHQEIAAELGTAREVVSRILEDFSSRGLVESSRGQITVRNHDALDQLAHM
jgi:CRP/FNR family transcriptional regulator